jgi:hypothetical protein
MRRIAHAAEYFAVSNRVGKPVLRSQKPGPETRPDAVCQVAFPLGPGRGGRAVCDLGVVDGWIEVARSPPAESGMARADLDAFLSQRGLSRAALAEGDIRIDLV